ncbi:uncharacterized protein Pyn_40735 [Prunus yedoensis var. nudiflora]|uniref:DUF4408 domain-containing protein n=1 Tax=Prunus yedoensis var. nudiflora TaxID=2094558 RepID=A0A314XLB0_PRUYE|nr:uncharacterized protein Pyn_40735 [Prunus yedoensis var. nudiflora]
MSMSSSNTWLLSLKVVLISTGLVSMAVALKLSAPVVSDIVSSQVPSLWSSALSWLRPPYLYILINCIIISIVASYKLHPRPEDSSPEMIAVPAPVTPVKISGEVVSTDYAAYEAVVLNEYGYDANVLAKVPDSYESASGVVVEARISETAENEKKEKSDVRAAVDGGDEAVRVSTPVRTRLQRKDSMEFWLNENEKPPVSSRFGHRKSARASPEGGKSLGVAKPKRQDTLESTWKTITEGRSMPLTRHLKKSDTWDTHVRSVDQNTPPKSKMNKSETFQDQSSATVNSPSLLSPSTGSGRLRKEPSLSQDDLNRRVEAFIKKFNEEMRLQRQESLNQYHEMIRSGARAPLAH